MKKALIAGVAMLVIAAIAVGVIDWSVSGNSSRSPSAPDAAAELRQKLDALPSPSRDAVAETHAARVISHSRSKADWWQRPLSEVWGLMQAAAESGDMQAAYALGSRFSTCMKVLRERTPETLLAEYQEDMESIEVPGRPEHTSIRLSNTNQRFQRELENYEDCAVVGEERVSGYLSWLERAGRAGVVEARLAFARHAMDAYQGDRGALISEIEVASDRRALARGWLEQLVRDGNEYALDAYAAALWGQCCHGLYAKDMAKASAYGYALDLVRSRRVSLVPGQVDRFPPLWAKGPDRYGDFTPQQWDEITVRGREIFRENFEHLPPNR